MKLKKLMRKIGNEVSRFGHKVEREIRRVAHSRRRAIELVMFSSIEGQTLYRLLQQQEEIQRHIREVEQERQKRLAYIKQRAEQVVAVTRKNFNETINRDAVLLKERQGALQKNKLDFQQRDAKLKQMEDALLALESGDISKLEAVSQDIEIRTLFPNLDYRILEIAAKAGKTELVKLLMLKKNQEKLDALMKKAEENLQHPAANMAEIGRTLNLRNKSLGSGNWTRR